MLKIENTLTTGFGAAYRGMRNPLNSWNRSTPEADLALAKKLISAGTEHRKFLRMIHVSVDVTAPLFWWKQFDTYKVGTTANSCSTMHTITKKPFTKEDFTLDNVKDETILDMLVDSFEQLRLEYNKTKDQRYWRKIIELLPCGYNQKRTVDMDYETLLSIHRQRKGHKLTEWHVFCEWVEGLPLMKDFIEAAERKEEVKE